MGEWVGWFGQTERRRSRPNTQFNIKPKQCQQQKKRKGKKQQ